MYGLVMNVAVLYILFRFWKNSQIELKWKIILTAALILFKFVVLGLYSLIISVIILITMIIILRLHGSKIR